MKKCCKKGHIFLNLALCLILIIFLTFEGCSENDDIKEEISKEKISKESELNISGTWKGPASDNTGPGTLTLILTQTDKRVEGTIIAVDASGKRAQGNVTGNLKGTQFSGDWSLKYGRCNIAIHFSSRIDGARMSGTYSGTNTCSGPVINGVFQLKRQ